MTAIRDGVCRATLLLAAMWLLSGADASAQQFRPIPPLPPDCGNLRAPPDIRIPACTDIIDARRAPPRALAYALRSRSIAYRFVHNLDRALADINEAVRIEPGDPIILNSRAITWRLKGDVNRAMADHDLAVRINPRYAAGFKERAITWSKKGDRDRALADFNHAISLAPNNAEFYTDRGILRRMRNEFDLAIADHSQAIRLNPRYSQAYNNRGFAYREKGDLVRAMADFDRALALDPSNIIALGNRGRIWRQKGDNARALADFNAAIRVEPQNPLIYVTRGQAFEAMNDRDRAIADFRQALAVPARDDRSIKAQETARTRLAVLTSEDRAPTARPAAAVQTAAAPAAPRPDQTASKSAPAATLTAPTASRVALVIGNSAYAAVTPLPNAANDARGVAKALRDIGFDVIEGTDLDHGAQERLVRDFLRRAATAKIALLFYAGHGMQVDGKNYLVPVDAKLAAPTDLPFETLEVDKVLAGLDDETRTNIVILDACRDNPLAQRVAGRSRGSASGGLAAVSTGTGTLIAFATAPGKVALDGASGGPNSPFTTALLKHIRTPGLEVRSMLTRVRAEVVAQTKGKQIPWDNSSLLGEVFLASNSGR